MSLFNNKIEKKEEAQLVNSSNTIGKGTVIKGDLETYGNIRIEGKVYGNVKSKSKISLGEGSFVEGNIISQNAVVEGEVKGKVEISDNLILKPTAKIYGDIYTGKLIIETGAVFNGSCKMGDVKQMNTNNSSNGKPSLNGSENQKAKATATA
ncbi:bactofilin family protein [Flexithrix dorotheae]|uniref:bactofilin family protein n=1 Tax=Flexithrix dorotheae TaxID=70993 RepID=UPI00035E4FA4|nr:polymer-forming cytoskeletal protein [Flexithrix dorotheae]